MDNWICELSHGGLVFDTKLESERILANVVPEGPDSIPPVAKFI